MVVTSEMLDMARRLVNQTSIINSRIADREKRRVAMSDTDRGSLLNWIDSAIGDLESLKRLLENGQSEKRVQPLVQESNITESDKR